MKKVTFVLVLVVISFPISSFAMTVGDVEQQLNLYKIQAPSVLGASTTSVYGDIRPMPPVPAPDPKPLPTPVIGGTNSSTSSTTDIYPLPPVPAPLPPKGGSSTDVPKLQLSPEQVRVLMQGLKYADPDGSSMIIRGTIKPGQTDSTDSQDRYVKKLQIFLNAVGCNLPTTGKFGAITKRCVKDFQKKKGLKPDGVVGPNFRKEMAKEIDTVTSVTNTTP